MSNIDWIVVSSLVTNFFLLVGGYFMGRRAELRNTLDILIDKPCYVPLDEEDLVCLLGGGVLTVARERNCHLTKICLKDIGYDRMSFALVKAVNGTQQENRNKIIT